MLQINEFNQGYLNSLWEVWQCPRPWPGSLAADYFWGWGIKVAKKTTTIYTRKKIDNEGRDEVNEGTMQESDNIVDINDENFDINHADSVNEEPITITENYLGYSERDRFLRLREALEGDDFDKTEVNLKYGDK